MTVSSIGLSQFQLEERSFITKVYIWMSFALIITGIVAMVTSISPILQAIIFSNRLIFLGLLIGEFLLVLYLTAAIKTMSSITAMAAFLVYSALNGLTLSVIFLVYTSSSIGYTFFITAGTFAIMSAYGYFTKRDLTTVGNLCFMALIGTILASIVNIFFFSSLVYWITTYAGILVFVGLTAYDTQKIKQIHMRGHSSDEEEKKGAIIGALTLYLDFINLFLYLLRIFGKKK